MEYRSYTLGHLYIRELYRRSNARGIAAIYQGDLQDGRSGKNLSMAHFSVVICDNSPPDADSIRLAVILSMRNGYVVAHSAVLLFNAGAQDLEINETHDG